MQTLASFTFTIRYRPGKRNILADILSRKDTPGKEGEEYTLLPPRYWDRPVLMPVSVPSVVERVLIANRTYGSLDTLRKRASSDDAEWTIDNGLLMFNDKLVVPDDSDLRARLLDEIHRQPGLAHPGEEKTRAMLSKQYYWPG